MIRKKHMTAAIATTGALALTLSACGGGDSDSSANGKGAVILGTIESVTSLDPAGAYDMGSQMLMQNLYQTLMKIPQGKDEAVPDAAKKCGFSDDTTYTCTLEKGLKFSNGDKLTSKDVKFSFDRLLRIKDSKGPSSLFENFDSVETPDAHTVKINLKKPDATMPQRLSHSAGAIVDHQAFPKGKLAKDTKVVGSGPYALDKYVPKQQASLKRNDKYSGGLKVNNDQVLVQFFSDASAMKKDVENGDIDVAYRNFSPTDINSLRKKKSQGVKVVQKTGTEKRYLAFNTNLKPGKKKATRRAVAQSVDRESIAKNVLDNTVDPLYSMVGKGDPGHIDAFKDEYGAKPDKAAAKKTLRKAGVKKPVKLQMWYTPTHYNPTAADEYTEVKRQLEKTGLFEVSLKSAEWQQYLKGFTGGKGSYPSFQVGWFPDFPDPDNDLAPFYDKDAVVNTHYENKKIQKLLTKEQGSTKKSDRVDSFKEIQKIAAKDAPMIPLWQGKLTAVKHGDVEGVNKALDPLFFRFNALSKGDS